MCTWLFIFFYFCAFIILCHVCIITYSVMDIILTTKSLIQSYDEVEVASNVALSYVLNIRCHFHGTVLAAACYIKKGYQKGPSNPS